jgi:hypothetical protein
MSCPGVTEKVKADVLIPIFRIVARVRTSVNIGITEEQAERRSPH